MASRVNGHKRKSVEKPLCKYGLSCYQKNPEHRKKFKHPPGKESETSADVNVNSLNDAPKADTSVKSITDIAENVKEDTCANQPNKVYSDDFKVEETVDEILKSMPQDFFDFWSFCTSVEKSNPEDAFLEFGYKLVGVYDLLAQNLPSEKKVDISCHWRYFYDPPEFQTVIKKDGKDMYHIGYFRDDPSEKSCILASNSAAIDGKLNLMGDNIFCAMNVEIKRTINTLKSKSSKSKALKLQEDLLKFASEKKYSIDVQSAKSKQRQKKVVAKTFHGLGIVVPVKNDIGYRPLPDSNTTMKTILKKIVSAESEAERIEQEESLDEIITNVQFANDECDYGMGLELGIDLFCFGDPLLHGYILSVLPLAYTLLKRPKYASIVKAHLNNRKKSEELCTLK